MRAKRVKEERDRLRGNGTNWKGEKGDSLVYAGT